MKTFMPMRKQIRKITKTAKRKRQEKRFCRLYAEFVRGAYCVTRAGIEVKCPDQLARKLLKQPAIQAEIDKQEAIIDEQLEHERVMREQESQIQALIGWREYEEREEKRYAPKIRININGVVYTNLADARAAGVDI